MPQSRQRLIEVICVGAGVLLFLGLSLYQIDLPGLYYDEALDTVPAMQLLMGQSIDTEPARGASLVVGDLVLPLMVMDYVGPVNTYLTVPFFALFGVNFFAIRLMVIMGGAITLVLTYVFAREHFNRWVGGVAVLLLAVHPSFIFFTRQGIHVTSILSVIAMGALLCLSRWLKLGERRWLYAGLFLLGLGLTAKFLFLWMVVALGIAYFIFRNWVPKLDLAGIAIGFSFFALGAAPLIVYNAITQGTISVLTQNLSISQEGVNNADVFSNLLTRLDSLRVLLDGSFFWFLGGVFSNPLYSVFFGLAVLIILAVGLASSNEILSRSSALFLLVITAIIIVVSSFTVSGLWATHLYFLLPLVSIIISVAGFLLWRGLARYRLGFYLAALSVLILVAGSLVVDVQYHEVLSQTGGLAAHSDANYRLAEYLENRSGGEPIAMDWGIRKNVQILTMGRVNPVEIFQWSPESNEAFQHALFGVLRDPTRLYVFHTEEFTFLPRFEAFVELSHSLGKTPELEKTISHRNGNPLYLLFSVQ
jgi:hypothetical protein